MRLTFANPITVTLSRPASPVGGPAASVTVANVQEQMATQQDVDSPMGGAIDGTRRTFRLWLVECSGLLPHDDYEITKTDGTVWIVKQTDVLCKGREFRLHCLARVGAAP